MPLYLIKDKDSDEKALVTANTQSSALKEIAGRRYEVETIKDPSVAIRMQNEGIEFIDTSSESDDERDEEGSE